MQTLGNKNESGSDKISFLTAYLLTVRAKILSLKHNDFAPLRRSEKRDIKN